MGSSRSLQCTVRATADGIALVYVNVDRRRLAGWLSRSELEKTRVFVGNEGLEVWRRGSVGETASEAVELSCSKSGRQEDLVRRYFRVIYVCVTGGSIGFPA